MTKPGRKRLYADPMDGYNVRLTPAQARRARRLGDGNMGAGIRYAIDTASTPVVALTPDPKKEELAILV